MCRTCQSRPGGPVITKQAPARSAALRLQQSDAGCLAVTICETLVPCDKLMKLATLATGHAFDGGKSYDPSQSRNAATAGRASDSAWQARGTLRGSLSSCPACCAFDGRWRYAGIDAEHFRQRGAFLAGSGLIARPGLAIFDAHAAFGPGHAARRSGPLHGACGTLLLKPQ